MKRKTKSTNVPNVRDEEDTKKDKKTNAGFRYRPDGSIDIDAMLLDTSNEISQLEKSNNNDQQQTPITYACSIIIMSLAIVGAVVIVYQYFFDGYGEGVDLSLRTPCSYGICMKTDPHNPGDRNCPVLFPNTILLPTIISTKSNQLVKVLKEQSAKKQGFGVVNFPEWVEATPNRTRLVEGLSEDQYLEAYQLRLRTTIQKNRRNIQRKSGKQVLHGRFFYQESAGSALSTEGSAMEQTLLKVSSYPGEGVAPAAVSWIAVLRDPIDRLHDLYDRRRANKTDLPSFSDCALDSNCATKQDFARWCSLQTSTLCGYDPVCSTYPHTPAAIERAKRNMESKFDFVGIVERFDDSLKVLRFRFPAFFEDALSPSPSRASGEVAADIRAALEDYCSSDLEIYLFAKKLFSQGFTRCSQYLH